MIDGFYRAFEDRHRGSRELIKSRIRVYLPFLTPILEHYPDADALDLGCGRGEWLELIAESGFKARGVDLDSAMLAACRERNLFVEEQDALSALRKEADASLAVISAFHLVEHLEFDEVRMLIAEAMRSLLPGGILILETPNPENIVVACCNFYLDPTHQRPIPPSLLHFAVEHAGFNKTKILRLQEPPHLLSAGSPVSLMSVLEGVSPDYAVVAQKGGNLKIDQRSNDPFDHNYGLELPTLAGRFDSQIERRMQQAEAKAQQAEAMSRQAESRTEQALTQLEAIYGSTSWRMTAPLRAAALQLAKFSPTQIRSIIRTVLRHTALYLGRRPVLRKATLGLLNRLPRLKKYLSRAISSSSSVSRRQRNIPVEAAHLPRRARRIYSELMSHVNNKKG